MNETAVYTTVRSDARTSGSAQIEPASEIEDAIREYLDGAEPFDGDPLSMFDLCQEVE